MRRVPSPVRRIGGLAQGVLQGVLSRLGVRSGDDTDQPDQLDQPDPGSERTEPAPENGAEERENERLRAQVAIIRRAFAKAELGEVSAGPEKGDVPPKDDADVHYLFRPGHVLARERDVDALRDYFAGKEVAARFEGELGRAATPVDGVVLLRLPRRVDRADDVLATLTELERAKVVEPGALTPDHVLYLTPKGHLCPAIEPEPVRRKPSPWPPLAPAPAPVPPADRVRVGVVDSGLWTDAVGSAVSPWLEVGDVVADPSDEEHVNPAAIHPYAGHGTFVAGVITCMAPDTRVEVEGVLVHGGAVYESEIVAQLHEALRDDDHPQLINISAGTHTRSDFALLGFEILAAAHGLDDGEETLVIAAAGNDSSTSPFWPAAFPWVASVGSVDETGLVSDFSNRGRWVDVYARGRDLINAFPKGSYTCTEPPNTGTVRTFAGLARWSGTSFSAPIVTGLIAARMRATGETARTAWASVQASASSATDPAVGTIAIVGPLS